MLSQRKATASYRLTPERKLTKAMTIILLLEWSTLLKFLQNNFFANKNIQRSHSSEKNVSSLTDFRNDVLNNSNIHVHIDK